jgi:hypothetical protein
MRLRITLFFLAVVSLAYAAEKKYTLTSHFWTLNDEDMPDGLKSSVLCHDLTSKRFGDRHPCQSRGDSGCNLKGG